MTAADIQRVVPLPNAIKADGNKPSLALIPRCAIEAEGRVLDFGAKKYTADNWRKGFAWRRLISATLRHVFAIADGEDRDPETGELHTAHARCMLGFLHEHMERGLGTDDRYKFGPPVTPVVNAPRPPRAPSRPVVQTGAQTGAQAEVGWQEPPCTCSEHGPCPRHGERIAGAVNPVTPPWTFWYIATPYSKFPGGRELAFEMACEITARLAGHGLRVFSPIAHSHPVSRKMPPSVSNTDHDLWINFDRPMMEAASGLISYEAQSWDVSRGMRAEIDYFIAAGKPIVSWNPLSDIPIDKLRVAQSGNSEW